MAQNLTREQFLEILKKLPEERQNLIFSEKTAKIILDVCDENGVSVGKISEVAGLVGRVLMDILPKDQFQNVLEREVGLLKEIAVKVAEEIDKEIFDKTGESLPREEAGPKKPDIYREAIE